MSSSPAASMSWRVAAMSSVISFTGHDTLEFTSALGTDDRRVGRRAGGNEMIGTEQRSCISSLPSADAPRRCCARPVPTSSARAKRSPSCPG